MDIKILVSCDKDYYVPDNKFIFPIQVGTTLGTKRYENMFHDDDGDNISEKNRSFCELTAQYWAWKNLDADYFGFFHYRRYFCFDDTIQDIDVLGNVGAIRPSDEILHKYSIEPDCMESYIRHCDVIAPRKRKMNGYKNLYEEYCAPFTQHKEDIDAVIHIIEQKYPEFSGAMHQYLNSTYSYDCNMFIMKKQLFGEYCTWLFDILFEAEKVINISDYNVQEYRVFGYLAERLCGIYITYLKMQKIYKIEELPKVLFSDCAKQEVITPLNNQSVAIVIHSNELLCPFLSVTIESILETVNNNKLYEIIVIHNDISKRDEETITQLNHFSNVSIRFANISHSTSYDSLKELKKFDIGYFRLLIPEIINGYSRVICLEPGMVVMKDLASLYEKNLHSLVVGAVRDIDFAGHVKMHDLKMNDEYLKDEIGLNNSFDYFQSGVMVLDLNALKRTVTPEMMLNIAKEKDYLKGSQDVLNKIFRGKVCFISQKWNVISSYEYPELSLSGMWYYKMAPRDLYYEYEDARKYPSIIQYASQQKPWNVVDCDMSEYFWKIASESPFYPIILSKQKNTLAQERIEATCPNRDKKKSQRIMAYMMDHGVSCTILNMIKKGINRVVLVFKK